MPILPLASFIIVTTANLVLATLVLRRNARSATHNLFSLLALTLALWATANYLSISTMDPFVALWSTRAVMALAVLQSVVFGLLMHFYPRARFTASKIKLLGILLVTVIGVALTLSPWVFSSVTIQPGSPPTPQVEAGIGLFAIITVSLLFWGFASLLRKSISSQGVQKVQQRYLLAGLLSTFSLILYFILFQAAILNNTKFIPYAPLFVLPFVSLTAYTIVRHRLMDIRAALARSLSFSFLIGLFFLVYGIALIGAVPAISELSSIPSDFIAAGAALISVILARYAQDFLRRITDKFLFQQRADYRVALVKISQELSRTIEIKTITDLILNSLKEVVRSEQAIIFLRQPSEKEYIPRASWGTPKLNVSIAADHALCSFLKTSEGPQVKDELIRDLENLAAGEQQIKLEAALKTFEWLEAAVILPLFVDQGLSGFIILGSKKSGEPFLQDDVEFLSALAPQAATALENARLYKESLEFGKRLKAEVEAATRDLATANRQLKDLDQAKSEFLNIASHQLYTPLTAIRGYLSMLEEGDFGKIPEQQKQVIDILTKSSSRLIELIKNLLDISRIESGRLKLDLDIVDVSAMANELVQDLLPNARTKNLRLEFHPPATPVPSAVADRERLRQVMLNFIDNAIKYTESGKVDVYTSTDRDDIIFQVVDTGRGMKPEETNTLFNKFTRLSNASQSHTEGTGLGLYVARQIINEHHGQVSAESKGLGQGSTFTMRLPSQNSPRSLKLTDNAEVIIKAAEAVGTQ